MPHVGARGQRFRRPTDAVQESDTDGGQRQSRWLRCVPLTALLLNRPTPRSKQIVLTVAGEPQPCRRKSDIEVVPIGGRPEQSRGLNLESQRWHSRGLSFSLLSFFRFRAIRGRSGPAYGFAVRILSAILCCRLQVPTLGLTFDLLASPLPGGGQYNLPRCVPVGDFCVNGRPESRVFRNERNFGRKAHRVLC